MLDSWVYFWDFWVCIWLLLQQSFQKWLSYLYKGRRSLTQQESPLYESGNDDQTLLKSHPRARALILYWLRIISNFSFYVTDNPLPEALIYTLYSEYKEVFLHTTPLGRCNGFNKSLEKLPMMLLLSLIPTRMRLLFSQFLQVSNVK